VDYKIGSFLDLQLLANTKIEANHSAVYKTVFLLGASLPYLSRFLYCRAFIKERRVNPPLFKDFLRCAELTVFLLENSPTHF
jgi:hypothetical protein